MTQRPRSSVSSSTHSLSTFALTTPRLERRSVGSARAGPKQTAEEIAEAPQTVRLGDELPEVERIEYSYKPVLGDVPELDVPTMLPNLTNVANLSWAASDLPSIAPSNLPSLVQDDVFVPPVGTILPARYYFAFGAPLPTEDIDPADDAAVEAAYAEHARAQKITEDVARVIAQNPLEFRAAAETAVAAGARPADLGLDVAAGAEFCLRMMS